MKDLVQEAYESNLIPMPRLRVGAAKLLLTGFEQIAVVIKHLQDNAVFPAQELEGGPTGLGGYQAT